MNPPIFVRGSSYRGFHCFYESHDGGPGPEFVWSFDRIDHARKTGSEIVDPQGLLAWYDKRKGDANKSRLELIPTVAIHALGKVLAFGARKYAANQWQEVPDAKERYYAAALRHLVAWRDGETSDSESGMSHLWHALCCVSFLCWFESNEMKGERRAQARSQDDNLEEMKSLARGLVGGLSEEERRLLVERLASLKPVQGGAA